MVLFGLFLFKRIIAYLFLSMESFNFFGAKGRIRPVEEVIEERVNKKIKEEKEAKVLDEERQAHNTALASLKDSTSDLEGRYNRAIALAEKFSIQVADYATQNSQLKKQVEALLNQIALLQNQSGSLITHARDGQLLQEGRDVGEINPKSEESVS